MRRFLSLVGVAAATIPAVIAVPVIARPLTAPHPVAPRIADVVLNPLPAVHGVIADTGARKTKPFTLVGAAWRTGTLPSTARIEVRTHQSGHWSSWSSLSTPDEGPDDGSQDARAAAARHMTDTDPLWVGAADGVQARVVSAGRSATAVPHDLHVVLVNGGSSVADASPGPARPLGASLPLGASMAEAAQTQPTIYTRAQWGADESLRKNACPKGPDYSSTIKMGFVHHTDGPNGYTAAQVPSIIRSIYAYHVESNGWCDIGYNFLVDRFGRIWEGRYGGITKAVIGAHTGGFNTNTFGVSMIGTFSSVSPPAALLSGLESVFAWKLGMYYRDPLAKTTLVAASFSGSRYATGTTVTFNTISGHRDADTTTCPGSAGYATLPTIRTAVKNRIGAGFVAPSVSPASVRMLSGQGFAIKAGVLSAQSWTATVSDAKTGTTVKTLNGESAPTAALSTSWDGTGLDGLPVPPGTYHVTLTGSDATGSTDVPYTATVTVIPPVTATGPATSTDGGKVTLSGVAAPNAAITVTLQPATQGAAADVRSLTASSAGVWTISFTANDDYGWSAATQGWSTPTSTTTVVPDVTSPSLSTTRSLFVASGGSVVLSGTGLPGTTFVPVTTPAGGKAVTGASVTVRPDGTWSGVTVAPSVPTVVTLQRSASALSTPVTVYPVAPPTATAPAHGYAQRAFTVTGSAGAPVSVQLWTKPAGSSSYTLVKTVAAAANGAYSVSAMLPAATSPTTLSWKVVSQSGSATFGSAPGSVSVLPLFAPTASAPAWGYYRHAVTVTGKAVPGDVVTLWTKPSSGGTWSRVSAVSANATTGAFTRAFTLTRDTVWKVTSPTGTTAPRLTYVRPSISGPSRAKSGTVVYVGGYAVPGKQVVVNRRPAGTTRWYYVTTVTASSTGHWTTHFRLTHAVDLVAGSNHHWSPVIRIKLA